MAPTITEQVFGEETGMTALPFAPAVPQVPVNSPKVGRVLTTYADRTVDAIFSDGEYNLTEGFLYWDVTPLPARQPVRYVVEEMRPKPAKTEPDERELDRIRGIQPVLPQPQKDFAIVYCLNPWCESIRVLEESEMHFVCSTTKFYCRECPPSYAHKPPPDFLTWLQFEHKLKHGRQPVETDHIRNQGSDTESGRLQGPIDADVSPEWEENPGTCGDKKFLLRYFDKTDGMVTHGQGLKERKIERKCPEWMLYKSQVREFILNAYPLAQAQVCQMCRHTECVKVRTQKSRAGVWAGVIYLYHRQGMPASEVGEELGVSEARVEKTVLAINRRKAGLTAAGKALGRRGRPKAVPVSQVVESVVVTG